MLETQNIGDRFCKRSVNLYDLNDVACANCLRTHRNTHQSRCLKTRILNRFMECELIPLISLHKTN